MLTRHSILFPSLLFASVTLACGDASQEVAADAGPGVEGAASSSGGGGGGGTAATQVSDVEPNNGATPTDVQSLGDFDQPLGIQLTGSLPTAGYDNQSRRYLGDLDSFSFNVIRPGNFSISVTWDGDADVDVMLVTNAVLASDTTANKPARMANALGTGMFVVVVASASGPANYTATLRFDPLPDTGGSSSGGMQPQGTVLDGECTHSTNYGLDDIFIFWPNGAYVHNKEYTNIGTWERVDDGSYSIQGDTLSLTPNSGSPSAHTFSQTNNVEIHIDGDLYLCFDHS